MAETVKEELQRKLNGTTNALNEVNTCLKRYIDEKEILENRIHDLRACIAALELVAILNIEVGTSNE